MQAVMPSIIRADEGEHVQVRALGVRFLLNSGHADGRLSVVEHPLPARRLGAPPHVHRDEDEYSFVLEGRVGFQLGDDRFVVGPGDFVIKPRGTQHAFWNAGDADARMLEIISPGGFENYLRELARALGDDDVPAQREIVSRYHLEIDHTQIPAFAAEVGARLG